LDAQIGRILRFLDEEGLAENTLLLYSSDQGFFTGEHGWAEKRWMYEESFKSPLLIRWPKVIEPGTVIDDLVQNIDLAPTFIRAAGMDVPKSLHGRPLQPLFSKAGPKKWREEILYQYFDGGNQQKPGPYNMPRHEGIRNRRYKLISFYEYDTWEFYDLRNDPNELINLIDDSSVKAKIEGMKKRLVVLKERFSP